jgi:two-component system, sensor histidine kinase
VKGIPVLHKPVTPARLRRTLESLWQQGALPLTEPLVVAGEPAATAPRAAVGGHDYVP